VRRALPILLAVVVLSGCWPALKVAEPKARFAVSDESGVPIGGAKVMVESYAVPLGRPELLGEFLTDSNGVLDLHAHRRWMIIAPLPDVTTGYAWAYCVDKAGYRAVMGPLEHSHKPNAVVLEPSAHPSTCKPPDEFFHLRVVENE
jgi:hypothetical protein